jgi:acyl-coenzyme A synthetase/AMP-(fatty) acid ligase
LAVAKNDPGLFLKYWNMPGKKDEETIGEWFVTGDLAYKDEDGYFWFQGREDDIIKASGYRISLFDIQSALLEHEAVFEAAAVASPDKLRGNIVKAFIVLKPGYKPSKELAKDIQTYFKQTVSKHECPKEIEFLPKLPKTPSGKIRKEPLQKR